MRLAVTGAGGRLGSAIVAAVSTVAPGVEPVPWSRPDYDLDRPETVADLVDRARPAVVVHAAAWTDVDGCARDPELAMRRNAGATGALAAACVAAGVDLVLISTNEVFDGQRTDGRGYVPGDPARPINPYGASKLAGERAASAAFGGAAGADGPRLAIVRTAWLFGPPGADFPAKIVAAAGRAREAGIPLRVVADEIGSPTYAPDLAAAIVPFLIPRPPAGTFHVVNRGTASRSEWARETLRLVGSAVEVEDVAAAEWDRPSRPPRWAVLEPSSGFERLRGWREALAAYLGSPPVARIGAA
jgi:dTDP-4-dehydrorhamnose reductase